MKRAIFIFGSKIVFSPRVHFAMVCLSIVISHATFADTVTPFRLEVLNSYGGLRLRLPCSFSQSSAQNCMIDTGSNLSAVTLDRETKKFDVIGWRYLSTLMGKILCEVIHPKNFVLGRRTFPKASLNRCRNLDDYNSPLIGIDMLRDFSFSIDFGKNEFRWASKRVSRLEPLDRSADLDRIFLPVLLGKHNVLSMFDTGAPVSLVDFNFIASNAQMFVPSKTALSDGLETSGFRLYQLLVPIYIGGVEMKAEYVLGAKLKELNLAPFVIGLNHIKTANWEFDLTGERWGWAVYPRK